MPSNEYDKDVQIDLIEINGKLQRVVDSIDVVKHHQEDIAQDISEIKKAVYEPDHGIYARLREIESWKQTHSKLLWLSTSSLIGVITATAVSFIISLQ